jgi:hypothetical protein
MNAQTMERFNVTPSLRVALICAVRFWCADLLGFVVLYARYYVSATWTRWCAGFRTAGYKRASLLSLCAYGMRDTAALCLQVALPEQPGMNMLDPLALCNATAAGGWHCDSVLVGLAMAAQRQL